MNYTKAVRQEWANWASSYDWNIFGTLNFAVNKKLRFEDAQRYWFAYWNNIDKLCYGKSRSNQFRIPRFVYAHKGSCGDNAHIHFLAHSSVTPELLCVLINATWSNANKVAAVPEQNIITPIINKKRAGS